jgi:hypothetical protein
MAAKEHEEWNKKKEISSGGVLGFDYDDYINWGEWERGPQKNLKKRQAANNKPKIGAHTPGQARSDRRLV